MKVWYVAIWRGEPAHHVYADAYPEYREVAGAVCFSVLWPPGWTFEDRKAALNSIAQAAEAGMVLDKVPGVG